MQEKKELVNILRAELTLLTKEILQDTNHKKFKDLYRATRKLYEKMATIKNLSDDFDDTQILALLDDEPTIPEKQNSIDTAPQDTIAPTQITPSKKENPNKIKQIDDEPLYKKVSEMEFTPKTLEVESPVKNPVKTAHNSPSFKPVSSSKKISIGLNDRIAFINNLFDGDADAYAQTIKKIDSCASYEAALNYIFKEIKSKYHQWETKDEYEFRLIQLLELKFA